MQTSVNGKEAPWTEDIEAKWREVALPEGVSTGDVKSCNYFTPRPYVDTYNKGSREEGFVFTVKNTQSWMEIPRVYNAVIHRLDRAPNAP